MQTLIDAVNKEAAAQTGLVEIDLKGTLSLKVLAAKINEIVVAVNALEQPAARNRGPRSEGEMTEAQALSIQCEDGGLSHKAAAEKYGLSYGQVYSARNGYTFKTAHKEAKDYVPADANIATTE